MTTSSDNTNNLLSLIIPIYNEADHLLEFLNKIDSLSLPIEKEFVIVNDCSTDNSLEILNNFKFKTKVKIIDKKTNEGKGAALRNGIENANGNFLGIQDADFEYDIKDIERVIKPLLEDTADVVFGSRYKNSIIAHRTFHYLGNKVLTLLSNLASGLYLSDMETCYKFFKKEIIVNVVLESNRFGFEPEITAKLSKLKLRVAEIPISYFPRNYMEGKKITWKDGIAALGHIVRFNFFRSKDNCFKKELPKIYIPKGQHWL
jgi:glycosyltransferase involved in cell wall biosynthesis